MAPTTTFSCGLVAVGDPIGGREQALAELARASEPLVQRQPDERLERVREQVAGADRLGDLDRARRVAPARPPGRPDGDPSGGMP